MFYDEITIHKCKRFGVNKTATITITPKQKTVMILGRNGAGKSSFVDIGLSVLPIERNQFSKGGYREQRITHGSNKYHLKSCENGDHLFVKNGETLYEGKVASVYRELVQTEFGVTQRIHEVLVAKPNRAFTAMSPMGERREWITRLSKSDFNYVLGFYDRVRKEARAIGNVIKHQTGRLTSETAKLMDTEELDGLRVRYERVQDLLQALYSEAGTDPTHSMSQLENHLQRTCGILSEGSDWILKNSGYRPLPQPEDGVVIRNQEDLSAYIASNQAVMDRIMSEITDLSAQEEDLVREYRDLVKKSDKDPSKLQQEIDECRANIEKLLAKQVFDLPLGSVPATNQIHLDCKRFIDLIRTTRVDIDLSEADAYHERLESHTTSINHIEGRLAHLDASISHYESCQSVECPSCAHEFRPGTSESKYRKHLEERSHLSEELDRIRDLLASDREWILKYREVTRQLNQVSNFQRSHGGLNALWTMIGDVSDTQNALECAMAYSEFILDSQVYQRLETSLAVCEEALASCVDGDQSSALDARIKVLHKQLTTLRDEYTAIDERNRIAVRALRQRVEFRRQMERMYEEYARLGRIVDAVFVHGENQVIKQKIAAHQHELHSLKNTISGAEVQLGIVNDIQSNLDDLAIKDLHYKVLEQKLSPSSGYIADLISRDIGALLDVMNQLIASVWSYPITVLNCMADNGDLNYRFPMVVGDANNVVADISMGSSSQADIINFAFRLLVHKALEISNYPLIIDELERAFDAPHKEALYHVIQSLSKDDTWGQVYVISHNTDGMISYPNAEFVVLDDTGMNLPFEYNQNVVIK